MKWFAVFFGLLVVINPYAQENAFLDFDIDLLFGSPDQDFPETEEKIEEVISEIPIASIVKKRGITFGASFEFLAGMAPGWKEAPWVEDEERENFFFGEKNQLLKMSSSFSIDAQISEVFRVMTNVSFSIPPYSGFKLGSFFFDYNFFNKVFFRGGKYGYTWGISSNFGFTNLLARVPKDGFSGEAFTFKADIPVNIGGFQFIAMTRAPVMSGHIPGMRSLGYGAKYNRALQVIDLDAGVFYQSDMAFRSFLSLKKTIGKTEVYNEWLAAIDSIKHPQKFSGAVNIGFLKDFLDNKLSLNGELFYNAEDDALWYSEKTNLKEEEVSPYLEGLNAAINLVYRFDGRGSPRLFIQTRYSTAEESALFIPGFRLSPLQHLEFYFAIPMALGNVNGYYYRNTGDSKNRPFSVVLLFTLKGNVKAGYYY